jgi:hypothetical protein
MIDELNKHLPKLRKSKSLPFKESMNWDLDPNFNYDAFLDQPPPSVRQQVLSRKLNKDKKDARSSASTLNGEQEL